MDRKTKAVVTEGKFWRNQFAGLGIRAQHRWRFFHLNDEGDAMKTTYEIDPIHSNIHFSIRHLMISNVRGAFTHVKGTVVYDSDNPSGSSIQVEIDVNSIDTRDETRDKHLRTADFFDVEKYPTMKFVSTKIEKAGENEFKVTGDLTIHGVTKPVVLDVYEVSPETKDPWGNYRLGASAKAKVNRKDFGLTFNAPLETGGVMIGDEVKLEFDLEVVRPAAREAVTT
jgi:polyisoprenoid-binding protein YceI